MRMRNPVVLHVTLAAVVLFACSCATSSIALAPGADQVKLTHNAADVASCKAVGNVTGLSDRIGTLDIEPQLRNRTIGLGGNTVFLTNAEREGVAYLCQK